MEIKERITTFVKHKKLTISQFEKACNLSNGYIASMRKGFGREKLNNVLTKFPELNRDWLLYGEGEMLNYGGNKSENNSNNPNIVPLLPVSARGGSLDDFVASVKPEDCEKIISPINGVDFAMPVYGDSMEPEYPSGSTVLIKKINERAFIVWGQTYVLDTCNGSVIKRILPGPDENSVTCVSLNSEYPPFVVRFEDMFGMYRVLMVLSFK